MNLENYLKSLNVSEADIQRLKDEKIDCNVISLMTDEELSWFLKNAGDRILVRNFVKTSSTSEQRKEHLIKNVRERLAAIRSKRVVDRSSKNKLKSQSTASEGPNTKSTRHIYLGWKHRQGCRLIQVIEKKGGGTKLLSMPKDYRKADIIELGKKLYFPNGKSSKGTENQFSFELIDSSNKIVSPEKTVLEMLQQYSPKIPRIYLKTEKVEACGNNNDEQLSDGITESISTKECMEPITTSITTDEQNVTILYADTSVSKYTGVTSVSFKDKQQIFDQLCSVQGPPDVDYANFDPEDFNYQPARIEVNGKVMVNVEHEFLEKVDKPNSSGSSHIASTSSVDNFSLCKASLPIISRKDIKFSEKILGAGSQGTVREGNWLGTQVAIKSFKTGRLTENELREVNLLARIRHPYIIQIMGICLENRQTHILFELVKGDNLGDILFDEEKKERYNLDNKKKTKLLFQVCQAISYLHGQTNPIIHQDIKPDNILVSENLVVKLCDLGLAKLKNMATQFRTVVGSIKGTIAYMAPEILLSKGTAATSSDIWSLGCTIFETYSEEDVWPDLGEDVTDALKNKMRNLESPNVNVLPPLFQPIVQKCFNYNPTERPAVEEVMDYFSVKIVENSN